ncbi:small ribosomal subunit protein mS39-like [Brevipalpus obovatus]|uniref:small ribosomal subunit protein mS39-like n=1 Tax=Brevipalpus obovatus TaxID=246614 RepID=UPI003D9F8159
MSIRNVATKLPPIKIPNRIPRGKTDILKALSMTVGMDSTAPEYSFIDDPRLLPTNSYQRLAFRLSKESGLKAAKYFFEKYPECFHRDQSEPKIEAFTFKEIYDESMDLAEDDLIEAISKNQVNNAQTAYQMITKKGIEISDATKVELIQLLLFFRNSEPSDPDIKSQTVESLSPIVDPGISLDVFQSIKNKNTLAYSSMIAGLTKIGMKERASFLAKEAMDSNIPLTVEAYNYLILYIRDKFRNKDEIWENVLNYLQIMSDNHVSPNVETFNCVLFTLRGIGYMPQVCQSLAKKVMHEMKNCKIEPSLYTYQLLLDIFCTGRDPNQRVLEDILLALDGKKLTMQTAKDCQLFVSVMRLCCKTFGNPGLAYKLHDIVTQHENFLLLDHNESFKKDY